MRGAEQSGTASGNFITVDFRNNIIIRNLSTGIIYYITAGLQRPGDMLGNIFSASGKENKGDTGKIEIIEFFDQTGLFSETDR